MKRRRVIVVTTGVVAAVALSTILVAQRTDHPSAVPQGPSRGGVLRIAMRDASLLAFGAFDPQQAYWSDPMELYRCCLLRTLLSYRGRPTTEGGASVFPDLAEAMPSVSSDGLTWTFHLKAGLHYGPPLTDALIIAPDVIRAIEREATLPRGVGYGFYYSVIQGFDAYAAGTVGAIFGLQAPDNETLIVRLTKPTTDLAYRMSLPAAAPIPAIPGGGALGVATGHKDYGRFLVSSGPYMLEGSEELDFSVPPGDQQPVSGYRPGRSITLVRNPSWNPRTDQLRGAFVDRIEILLQRSETMDWAKVRSGRLDLVLDANPPPEVMKAYRADPSLAGRLRLNPDNFVAAISVNLAVPPFDDVHVRRALNWAVDKTSLVRLVGSVPTPPFGYLYGELAGHLVPDSLEDNLLKSRNLFATQGGAGSVQQARAEMARSRYDRNNDGVCDVSVCTNVLAVTQQGPFPAMAAVIERDLEPIGITLHVRPVSVFRMFGLLQSPQAKIPLGLGAGWAADYPSASQAFTGQFLSSGRGNITNVGVEPRQLRDWGYEVTHVPNVDDRINACLDLPGEVQVSCWASLDQYLMENVVPFVPYVFFTQVRTISARIARFSFAQFQGLPALDQIALTPSAIAESS